jgi:hypothetical protein
MKFILQNRVQRTYLSGIPLEDLMRNPKHTRSGLAWLRWFLAGLALALPFGCASGSYGPAIVAPSIVTQPASLTVTEGGAASFGVTTTGSGPMTFQWLKNGVAIPSATSAGYTTSALSLADTGTKFSVQVTNRAGSILSDEAIATVTAPPTILTQPIDKTVLYGTPTTFTVVVSASAPITYQWYRGTAAIPGATGASYTLASPQVATDNGAQFHVIATNPLGSVTSRTATLRVVPAIIPLAISTQPATKTVLDGIDATLNVVADGTGTLLYQWMKGGTDIPGATSSTLSFSPAVLADAGVYSVRVTDDFGTITSASATLTVNPSQKVNLIASPGFEIPNTSWTAVSTWYSAAGVFATPIGTTATRAHSGSNYSNQGNYVVNSNNPAGSMPWRDADYQTLTIPANAAKATFKLWMFTYNSTGATTTPNPASAVNTLKIYLKDASGAWTWGNTGVLATLATVTNQDVTATSATASWVEKTYSIDLTPYLGQTIRISIETEQTTAGITIFRTDDWNLEVTVPAP